MTAAPVEHPTAGDGIGAQILLELGKQTGQVALANQKIDQILQGQADHENRLRSLEAAKAKAIGAATASGILSGGIATLIYWALSTRAH